MPKDCAWCHFHFTPRLNKSSKTTSSSSILLLGQTRAQNQALHQTLVLTYIKHVPRYFFFERPHFVCMYNFFLPLSIFGRNIIWRGHYLDATLFGGNIIYTRPIIFRHRDSGLPPLFWFTFFLIGFLPHFFFALFFTPTFFSPPLFFTPIFFDPHFFPRRKKKERGEKRKEKREKRKINRGDRE